LNNINNRVGLLCTGLLQSSFVLGTESLIAIAIVTVLMLVDPISTFIAVIIIGTTSFVFLYFVRHKLKHLGDWYQKLYARMIKSANEAFGGIKEIKVLGREDYFIQSYAKVTQGYARSWIYGPFVSQLQRTVVETFMLGGIVIMSLVILLRGQGGLSLIPILALFAAAAFRLMPSINRMNTAISTIRYYYPALDVIHKDISLLDDKKIIKKGQVQPEFNKLLFKKSIELKNVSFRYPDADRDALSKITLSIPKGYSVAFIGPSGAGKTSLVDIILGLLNPTSGKVVVDGQDIKDNLDSWRQQIGYIPQFIYLSDDTIRHNVAFGIDDDKIDDKKVWNALRYAQLEKFVRKLPDGLGTIVGEHGCRLSGGEHQRVGIARALYHDPKVLVLDEATSHLDIKTERGIMNTIEALKGEKTLLIITHRLSTVENCDVKYTIKSGKMIKTTYNQRAVA
jgi:ABC-type multidrug transport system fused ATPase/permease subunit